MTAEIAIANQSAVALAADSAVTVGSQKIYNGAIKLFALSKVEPVGVMIYGNANLMNMPWETIIKEYRKELGSRSFPKIVDYRDDFIKHIEKKKYFSKEEQDIFMIGAARHFYEEIKKEVANKVKDLMRNERDVSEDQTLDILHSCVDVKHESLKNNPIADRYTKKFEVSLRDKLLPVLKVVSDEIFPGMELASSVKSKLYDIVVFALTRQRILSDYHSGVVIAGFGTDELYPAIHTTLFDGVVGNRPKCIFMEDQSEKLESGVSVIIPFAQQEMVRTFLEGIDPELKKFQDHLFTALCKNIPDLIDFGKLKISPTAKAKMKSALSRKIGQSWKELSHVFSEFRIEMNTNPVLSMVAALPKDELAAMAEALVNLTAFKRKMTNKLETVGGPIDVAVISKGDGLVWVKRKHYFPRELNDHFFENYFRGVEK